MWDELILQETGPDAGDHVLRRHTNQRQRWKVYVALKAPMGDACTRKGHWDGLGQSWEAAWTDGPLELPEESKLLTASLCASGLPSVTVNVKGPHVC